MQLLHFFLNGLSIAFLHFVCKLLSNLWEHHITTMLSEVFCLRMLTSKNQFAHTFLIDVIVIFSRVFGPSHEVLCRRKLVQLLLLDVVFSATKGLYNISGLFIIFKCPAGLLGTCQRFFIDSYNAQFFCIKGKWHGRTHIICSSFLAKKLLYPVIRHKKVYVYPHNFSVLICAFWALCF